MKGTAATFGLPGSAMPLRCDTLSGRGCRWIGGVERRTIGLGERDLTTSHWKAASIISALSKASPTAHGSCRDQPEPRSRSDQMISVKCGDPHLMDGVELSCHLSNVLRGRRVCIFLS